jgi:hypothetical protein
MDWLDYRNPKQVSNKINDSQQIIHVCSLSPISLDEKTPRNVFIPLIAFYALHGGLANE